MNTKLPVDFQTQQRLVETLCDPVCYSHVVKTVRLIETHISWVLLAGRYAYKIKKAVDLGFLDFTNLAQRRFCCEEEIRLNRRLAPQLYLDVIAIGSSPQRPEFGSEPALEYAVRMRRFASSNQMDRLLAHGLVTPAHIDRLAATLARFHVGLPPAPADSSFGLPVAIHAPALQNFEQLSPLLDAADIPLLERLRSASEHEYSRCLSSFVQRKRQGWIRECHGDLHLGNIVLLRDEPTPFDGIEFSAEFRWIDVMNEIGFLVMDLSYRNRADLAFRLLNGYLELTGDYAGLGVLRYYLAYRAVVRAKISAICAHQPDTTSQESRQAMVASRRYLQLAETSLAHRTPVLIITHGLPGCGKTTVAQVVLEKLQAIRIRSDIERKRLHGLTPLQDSRSQVSGGIYDAEATQRTYARLHELSRGLLAAGFTVIVDAAFLRQSERSQFRQLAKEMSAPFVILDVQAELATLRQRIRQRMAQASDASEADLTVMETLRAKQEPLLPEELAHALIFINDGDHVDIGSQIAWNTLEQLLAKT